MCGIVCSDVLGFGMMCKYPCSLVGVLLAPVWGDLAYCACLVQMGTWRVRLMYSSLTLIWSIDGDIEAVQGSACIQFSALVTRGGRGEPLCDWR